MSQLPCLHRACRRGASSPSQWLAEDLLPYGALVLGHFGAGSSRCKARKMVQGALQQMLYVWATPRQQLWLSNPLGARRADVAFGGWPGEAKVGWRRCSGREQVVH